MKILGLDIGEKRIGVAISDRDEKLSASVRLEPESNHTSITSFTLFISFPHSGQVRIILST